ncbi:unnamed protein product [Dibothriocephalus latus]|uniref:Uncharacterized protein n=1 Tax=Dibothriocephalus latus TaxID=60516 RepID=A0A3P7QVV1_DIBLA|nr:unnamed protein product [Dibothriocephalus latus]
MHFVYKSERTLDDSRFTVTTGDEDTCLSQAYNSQLHRTSNRNDNASQLRSVTSERTMTCKRSAQGRRSRSSTVLLSPAMTPPTPAYSGHSSVSSSDEAEETEETDVASGRRTSIAKLPPSVEVRNRPKSTQDLSQLDAMFERLTTKFVEVSLSTLSSGFIALIFLYLLVVFLLLLW